MKLSNRRKGTTFLDYKDGHIVPVDYGTNKETKDDVSEPNISGINIKGKTIQSKFIIRIFSIIIGLMMCIGTFNYVYSSTATTIKVFNFLSGTHSTAQKYNQSYLAEKREEQFQKIQNGESFINPLDFSTKKEYEKAKEKATLLTEDLSIIDQNIFTHYDSLKTSIIAYLNGDKGYLSTSSSLRNLQRNVKKDYESFLKTEFGHDDIYKTLKNRYELLLNFLDVTVKDFSRDTIGDKVNELINSDNELNVLEYKILKQYLDDNGLLYIEENSQIIIA